MAFALPVVVLLVPWLAWKLFYYGDLLPNTWWVKGVEPSVWRIGAGVRYLSASLFEPPFPVLLLIAGAIRAARAGHLTRAERFGLTVVGLHLAWVVYVGGDQMPLYRLLVPILPVAVWLAWSSWLPDLRRLGDSGLVMVTVEKLVTSFWKRSAFPFGARSSGTIPKPTPFWSVRPVWSRWALSRSTPTPGRPEGRPPARQSKNIY